MEQKKLTEDIKSVGSKIKAVPTDKKEIGIDTESTLMKDLIDYAEASQLDTSTLEAFSNVAQTREQIYTLIDMMSEDDRVSSVLETYAEDSVETNEQGDIIWCESSDGNISKYISYLIDSLNISKNIYEWTFCLIKYGDVYLRLFKNSDYLNDNDIFDSEDKNKALNEDLKESVFLNVSSNKDKYVPYVEMVPNPAEMFELTRFGKTMGYIEAPTKVQNYFEQKTSSLNNFLTYNLKKNDVNVFDATDFVHASLKNDNSSRKPEEVNIFMTDEDYKNNENATTYKVKKGQSLLYNSFRIWRLLSLLENSVILNRLTKSSIVRILNVDVGDMPKEQVQSFMTRLKSKIEQKSAIDVGNSMQEYTNPGPIENILYVPTYGTQGTVTAQSIGGDVDPKQLTDLDYFLNKFYGSLRVPKQFFAQTDDSAGFNGGSSLSIISSRYGKVIKRIQSTMCQLVTDLINLFLIDRGLTNYINKFTIRMQAPTTQEELDRRENMRNEMSVVNDVMNLVGNSIEDNTLKLKLIKELLSRTIANPEVIDLLQNYIVELESKEKETEENKEKTPEEEKESQPIFNKEETEEETELPDLEPSEEETELPTLGSEDEEKGEESYIPSPDEMGIDLTNND